MVLLDIILQSAKEFSMKKFSVFLACLILLAIGGVAFAQAPADANIQGYFVAVNNQPAGPYDATGLRQLISDGRLNRETLVWKEGMANWEAAGRVAELSPLFPSLPPPLPSAPPPLAGAAPAARPPALAPAPRPASSPGERSGRSFGGGLIWDWSLNNHGRITTTNNGDSYGGYRNMTIGGFLFYDTRSMSLSFHIGPAFWAEVRDPAVGDKTVGDMKGDGLQFGVSLLWKYPFDVGPVTLFPLLGADLNFYTTDFAMSQFGLLGGAGCDFFFTDSLFVRTEALFSFRFPAFDFFEEIFKFNDDVSFSFGKGPRIKVGVGYAF